ncbi:MAG: hypothetical protein ACLFVU_10665 [Phycisphaerae bacterium]
MRSILIRSEPGRREALTSAIDIMPTFMELFGAELPENVRGKSLLHLLSADGHHHDAVMYGYHRQDINITDGGYTYTRQPLPQVPCYQYTSTLSSPYKNRDLVQGCDVSVFLPTTRHPRVPD